VSDESVYDDDAPKGQAPVWQTFFGAAVLLALVGATVLAIAQIYPSKLRSPKNPSFVDNIVDDRVVILLIRVALVFAAGYVVISIVGLIVGRRWLAELGPFKASEPIAHLGRGTQVLEKDLGDARDDLEYLKRRLVESDEALAQARSVIESLVGRIDTMDGNS
jgi:hypothetical protein